MNMHHTSPAYLRHLVACSALLVSTLVLYSITAFAGSDANPPAPTTPERTATQLSAWLDGDYLTGNWGGWRTKMENHGVDLDLELTQFYQGLTSGTGDKHWEYGGK